MKYKPKSGCYYNRESYQEELWSGGKIVAFCSKLCPEELRREFWRNVWTRIMFEKED